MRKRRVGVRTWSRSGGQGRREHQIRRTFWLVSSQTCHRPMKAIFAAIGCCTLLAACRIEKVRTADSASASAAEPGAGLNACGITSESRVRDDGIGVLRMGMSLDAVRANCTVLSEKPGANDAPMVAMV